MATFICSSTEETEALARQVGALLRPGDIIAYRGGMGAGKTTFTRGLAAGMGIDDWVSSPTFALVHEYRGAAGQLLCHFDMYRINGFDDLYSTGFFDYLEAGGVLAVEWSENIEGALPEDIISIELEITGEESRRITIKGDQRFETIGG